MAHAQARVTALLRVGRRSAPVLDQEERQAFGRGRQVFLGIHGAQHRVGRNLRVEALDEQAKHRLAAGQLVHAAVEHWR